MVTKEDVMEVLKSCYDPEIPINIVDLGLIYNVDVEDEEVHIKMTLTTPGCPMGAMILDNVRQKVESIDGIKKAEVELVWEPPWTPDRISKK
ncbi:metal-sulfur cluster assembly factor [Methanococcoides orientis]|uniref:metal-sulfur cluster assembly factor n=1 Tax=Methanococcoides orientis TaxID=2822137 RepID=UPI001E3BCD6E|nr:metal-sulfur cluster assembly factor [Methanococcoides orientis]UGV39743.1 metal-sulfur cluster assembly factor [Methanococcoides orientis]